jgi:hypothetical protein
MQQKRSEYQRGAFLRVAHDFLSCGADRHCGFGLDAAAAVGARNDPERTVL